jgi:hypothetical protein
MSVPKANHNFNIMKPFVVIAFLMLLNCCATIKPNADNTNTRNATKNKLAMNEEHLKINRGETKQLYIPNRGSSGLQLVYELTDSTVVSITRKELPDSYFTTHSVNAGESLPALFEIYGIKAGTTHLFFREKRVGMPESPLMEVRTYLVEVVG